MIQPLNIIPSLQIKSKEQEWLKINLFPLSKNLKNKSKIFDEAN